MPNGWGGMHAGCSSSGSSRASRLSKQLLSRRTAPQPVAAPSSEAAFSAIFILSKRRQAHQGNCQLSAAGAAGSRVSSTGDGAGSVLSNRASEGSATSSTVRSSAVGSGVAEGTAASSAGSAGTAGSAAVVAAGPASVGGAAGDSGRSGASRRRSGGGSLGSAEGGGHLHAGEKCAGSAATAWAGGWRRQLGAASQAAAAAVGETPAPAAACARRGE